MKKLCIPIIVTGVSLMMTSCATTSQTVRIAGHPYNTKPDCERERPLGVYDPKCDEPLLGFNGFSPMQIPLVSGIGGTSGPSF